MLKIKTGKVYETEGVAWNWIDDVAGYIDDVTVPEYVSQIS